MHRRHTEGVIIPAFAGMITAVLSVIAIFDTNVKPNDSQLKYLLMYKLSQDHIELFFAAIRCCGEWCPKPTCAQFVSASKRHEVESVNGILNLWIVRQFLQYLLVFSNDAQWTVMIQLCMMLLPISE